MKNLEIPQPVFHTGIKAFFDKFIDYVAVAFPTRFVRGFSIIENSVKQIRLYFTDLSFYDLSVLERMAIEYFSGVYTHVNLSTTGGNNRLEVIITLRRVEQ